MGKLAGIKILIVEDDAASRNFMKQFFEEEEAVTEVAGDGLEALRIFERFQPELVLLDIMLPALDGDKVLIHIKTRKPETKVIMTTGVSSLNAIEECVESGASSYIVKPMNFDSLMEVIEKTMGSND